MNLYREGAKTCSPACRKRASRAAKSAKNKAESTPIPAELRSIGRWVRWTPRRRGDRMTKVPVMISGHAASSTDSATWASFEDVAASTAGAGFGFVLNGDGIYCVDLDGVLVDGLLDPRAAALLESLDSFYVEVSPSGNGVHAWVRGGSPSGRKVYTQDDGLKVEWYSDGRYITVTGDVIK